MMRQVPEIPVPRSRATRPEGRQHVKQALLTTLMMVLIFFAAPQQTAGAWTAVTERAILARSLGTMPRPLRIVLTRHRGELYRAARSIPSKNGLPSPESIAAECDRTIQMIREQRPFALTARQLGRVGVLVAATADPYLAAAGGATPAPAHQGFELFTERMLHLMPFVITDRKGFTRQDLLEGRVDPAGYLHHGLEVSSAYGPVLEAHLEASTRGVEPWTAFDARSIPFGVSSLSVSSGASRVSAVWQWIWVQAGGSPAPQPTNIPPRGISP